MKPELIQNLCCPHDRHPLRITEEKIHAGEIDSGSLHCTHCHKQFAVEQGIPRFVAERQDTKFQQLKIRDQEAGTAVFVFSNFNREVELRALANAASLLETSNILDAGCGIGDCTERLSAQGGNIYSCDFSFQTLLYLKKRMASWPRQNVQLIQADTMQLPFTDGFFDSLVSGQVLQHLENRKEVDHAARELLRVTKVNGKMILTLFHYSKPLDWISKMFYHGSYRKEGQWDNGLHYFRYQKEEIRNIFKNMPVSIKIRTLKHLPDRLGTLLGKTGLALEPLLTNAQLFGPIGSYWLITVTQKEMAG